MLIFIRSEKESSYNFGEGKMDLKEKFGESPIKSKFWAIVVGLVFVGLIAWVPVTSWLESRGNMEQAVYNSTEGKFVVSFKKDQVWPLPDKWEKQVVKSYSLMTNQNNEFLVRLTDLVGSKEDIPCQNVVVESLVLPRLVSEPVSYLTHSNLSIPIKWMKPDGKNHRVEFADGYGNVGFWLCPNELKRLPLR